MIDATLLSAALGCPGGQLDLQRLIQYHEVTDVTFARYKSTRDRSHLSLPEASCRGSRSPPRELRRGCNESQQQASVSARDRGNERERETRKRRLASSLSIFRSYTFSHQHASGGMKGTDRGGRERRGTRLGHEADACIVIPLLQKGCREDAREADKANT